MRIDPEDLRRHYKSLSDEGLLDIDPASLAPVAQGIYEKEIARRGLDQPPEQEEEAYNRALPVFKPADGGNLADEPGPDVDSGPPPDWLEDAACSWSTDMDPSADYTTTGAEVQAALRDAGIPNRIVVKPPEPGPPSKPKPPSTVRSLYCVMVPGELGARAYSVVERKVFNRMAEAEWRSQLQSYSDEELRALNPEDAWSALLDRAERLKRAYQEEMARRSLQAYR
jgi:hypothetical protein